MSSGHFTAADNKWAAETTAKGLVLETACARRPNRWRYAATSTFVGQLLTAVPLSVLIMFVGLIVSGGDVDWRALFTSLGGLNAALWLLNTLGFGFQERDITVRAGARTLYGWDANTAPDVALYELRAVTVVNRTRLGPCLRLVDGDRRIVVPCGLLEGNQQLWDLVYHGIRHSVAAGAKTDERTRRLLALAPAGDGQG